MIRTTAAVTLIATAVTIAIGYPLSTTIAVTAITTTIVILVIVAAMRRGF